MKKPRTSPTQKVRTPEEAISRLRKKALDRRDTRSFLSKLIALALFVWVLFGVCFHMVPVSNDDMKPTLRARDLQIVYCFPGDLIANDVVVYHVQGMKRTGRIIGRPGDSIEITEENRVLVNGASPYEGNIYYSTPAYDSDIAYPLMLGEDEYFILSDFREGAIDSRQFGPVNKSQIDGKVIAALRRSSL